MCEWSGGIFQGVEFKNSKDKDGMWPPLWIMGVWISWDGGTSHSLPELFQEEEADRA